MADQRVIITTPTELRQLVEEAVGRALAHVGPAQDGAELVKGDDVCRALRISRPTLKRYRDEGLPFVRAGRCYRYRMAAVRLWLEGRG